MSRRDQLFQAVNTVQGQVFNFIDSRIAPAPETQSSSSQQPSSSLRRSDTTASALPLYTREPGEDADFVPPSVLNAPPGQAQEAANQMPRNRLAHGSGREARVAAAALREEQMRTGQLKTKHTFVSSGARVILDVNTAIPQKALTFMGGTADRGRGAMKGMVTIHAQPNERVSAVRIKIKAVVRVLVPRLGTPQQPIILETTHPSVEQTVEKEILLLQLESQLYDAQSSGRNDGTDPTILPVGKHEFPFSIDLPSQTSKGLDLPPSFILSPINKPEQVQRPQPKSKWESIAAALPVPQLTKEWAGVKWYAKVTVERPGIFRANERIFAPFVYLPPPPKSASGLEEQLLRRLRLAAETNSLLQRFQSVQGTRPIDLQRLVEPLSQWDVINLAYGKGKLATPKKANPANNSSNKPGLLSRMLFGSQTESQSRNSALELEEYSLHVPKRPFVFSVRSGIPYVISRRIQYSGDVDVRTLSRVPTVGLFQRANVFARGNKGPCAGTTSRFVASGRQPPDLQVVNKKEERIPNSNGGSMTKRRVEYWLGIIDLPPTCAPSFDTPILTLEYSLVVRHPQSPNPIHVEPIVLVCPPSRPVRIPSVAANSPSRTGTPAGASTPPNRRQGSGSVSANVTKPPTKVSNQASLDAVNTSLAATTLKPKPPQKRKPNSNATLTNPDPRRPSAAEGSNSSSRPLPVPSPATTVATTSMAAVSDTRPSTVNASENEKRRLQSRYEQEMSGNGAGASNSASSSSAGVATSSGLPSRIHPSEGSTSSSHQITSPPSNLQSPVTTPLTVDDMDISANDPENWQFHDDELADLPPSYFEATGMRDDD